MPSTPTQITVDPQGQTAVVAITNALNGAVPTAYTAMDGNTTATLPATISTRTTFFFANPGARYNVSVKINGVEVGNGAGAPAVADLTGGGEVSIVPATPGNVAASGLQLSGHEVTAGVAPTQAPGAGAGTTPTITITGNDESGTISVTAGTTPAAGLLTTLTFAGAYGTAPKVFLFPANAATAPIVTWVGSSTTTATINTTSTPVAATVYLWNYLIVQ